MKALCGHSPTCTQEKALRHLVDRGTFCACHSFPHPPWCLLTFTARVAGMDGHPGLPFTEACLAKDSTDCPTCPKWGPPEPPAWHHAWVEQRATSSTLVIWKPPSGLVLIRVHTLHGYGGAFPTHSASSRAIVPGLLDALFTAVVFRDALHLPRTPRFLSRSVAGGSHPQNALSLPHPDLEWPIEDSQHQLGSTPYKFRKLHSKTG